MIKKVADKILKCIDLVIEIMQRMWNVKGKALRVITETFLKSLGQNLSNLSVKHEIKKLQKTVPLGMALRAVLM